MGNVCCGVEFHPLTVFVTWLLDPRYVILACVVPSDWLVFLKVWNYTFFCWWHTKFNSLKEIIIHLVVLYTYRYTYTSFCFFALESQTKYIREDWVHLLIGGNCLALVLILISNAWSEFISVGNLLATLTNKKLDKPTISVLSPWFATFGSHLLGHQAQLGSFITACQSMKPPYLSQQPPQWFFSLFPKICEWVSKH